MHAAIGACTPLEPFWQPRSGKASSANYNFHCYQREDDDDAHEGDLAWRDHRFRLPCRDRRCDYRLGFGNDDPWRRDLIDINPAL